MNKPLKKHLLSSQINLAKFSPASEEEKSQQEVMSESTTFFRDGMKKLMRNPLAVGAIIVLVLLIITIIVAPMVIPYGYDELWLDYAQYIGIALALALVYTTMFWTVARYKSVTLDTLFGFGVLLALGIPLFLPYMHERYFFLADALTLALAFAAPAYAPVFILCQFGSLLGYFAYIRGYFILPMFVGTAAMLAAFVFICLYIHKSFQTPELECPYEQ